MSTLERRFAELKALQRRGVPLTGDTCRADECYLCAAMHGKSTPVTSADFKLHTGYRICRACDRETEDLPPRSAPARRRYVRA